MMARQINKQQRQSSSRLKSLWTNKKKLDVQKDVILPENPDLEKKTTSEASWPISLTAWWLSWAHNLGHWLCSSRASPLCSTASTGRYSPKSAIQPPRPSSSMLRLITVADRWNTLDLTEGVIYCQG